MPGASMFRMLLLILPMWGWMLSSASAQELALAGRGPRFLTVPKANARPVEIKASSSAVLRRVVSLTAHNATIGSVLQAIEGQTGFRFVYSRTVVPVEQRVDLRADRITVAAALTEVLLDTNIDVVLSYDGQLTLVARSATGHHDERRTSTIIGQVTDATTGKAVEAVEIFLQGTRSRTVTDSSGRYALTDIDSGAYTLIARRLGYVKQSRKMTLGLEGVDTVNVALQPAAVALNELVTTATGQQRRRDLGNSITTIRADSVMQTAPIRSLTDLLENRVPGLSVQRTTGAPGDPARLRLRGLGSPTLSNDPVFVVDGVRIYAAQSGARSGNLTNLASASSGRETPAPSPIDQIDPNIIETIEVFKGPSAATLYGADAANGVVVITTKRGKAGPTRWTANLSHGRTTTPGRYSEAYFRFGHTLLEGLSQFCTIVDTQCVADSLVRYQAMNDPAMTVLGEGRTTGLSLTASGGTQALTYSITGSYSTELGLLRLPALEADRFRASFSREAPDWMQRPHRYDTWSVGTSIGARLSAKADVTLAARVNRSEQQRSSLETQASRLSGMYVDKVNGKYYLPDAAGYTMDETSTVLGDFYRRTTASTLGFNTSLAATWRPRTWLDASAQAGLDVGPRADESFLPGGIPSAKDSGMVIRGTGRAITSTFNLQGQLRKPIGWGFIFRTNVGANLVTSTTNDVATTGIGLVPGTSALTGAREFRATDLQNRTSVFGWYIEPTLTGQRLSFSTGIRLDGGSNQGTRFSSRSGGGFLRNLLALPKLNGSWVISEEPWFPFTSLFSSLRLRGAYGQSQQQPQLSQRLRLYTPSVNHLGELLTLTTLGNSELRPERYVEFEGGFDADLLDNRLSIELSGYNKTTVDALMPVALPPSVNGTGSVIQNIGNIRNRGFDLRLTVTPVRTSALTWSTDLVFNQNDNVLLKLGPGVEENRLTGLVAGYPVGGRWVQPIIGYADEDGDGALQRSEIQVGDSLVFMGRILPNRQTSLFTNVALFGGALGISAGFAYETGATQVDETASNNFVLAGPLFDPSTPFSEQAAVVASITDSRSLASGQPIGATDYGVTQDISTFRFNSLAVNYRAPRRVARLIGAEQLSVAVQGSNLGLHSSYRGKDPDVSAWSPGDVIRDTGQLPMPRLWRLQFNVSY